MTRVQCAPGEQPSPYARRQEALWLLIALVMPLFVNLWVEQQFEASKVWLLRPLAGLLALLWLGDRMRGGDVRRLPASIHTALIALTVVLCLATALSDYGFVALFGTLDRANGLLTQLSYLLLFLVVATRIDAVQSRRLLHVMIFTAVPIALLGLAQAAGRQPFPTLTDARSPLTTTLGRANFTGAYLALLLPLMLTAARLAHDKWRRLGYAALFGLTLTTVALTQARAAWLAAAVGVGALLWLQAAPRLSRRLRWLTASAALTGLAGVLLLLVQGIAAGGSIAARWTIWQSSLRLLQARFWLGYGADTLELYFPAVYPPQLVYYQGRGVVVDRAHNWLLDWSLSYGVVATGLLLGLVGLIFQRGWRQLVHTGNDPVSSLIERGLGGSGGFSRIKAKKNLQRSAQSGTSVFYSCGTCIAASSDKNSPTEPTLEPSRLAACMATICAQLVGNLFLFEVAATAIVFWLLLAIVTAATNPLDAKVRIGGLPSEMRPAALAVALLFFGWMSWQSSVRPLLADLHSWCGTQALVRGDGARAQAGYALAVSYQPQRAAYHVALALTAAEAGRFVQAENSMGQAIARRPTDPVLYTHLAAIYAAAAADPARIDASYRAYEQAIALAPTLALTYQQYAAVAWRAGDAVRAQQNAQQAVGLDATDGVAWAILGWTHLRQDDPAAALTAFTQAVKWQPDVADLYVGLATAHVRQGNLDAARSALAQSLALDPFYPPALTLQVQLQE